MSVVLEKPTKILCDENAFILLFRVSALEKKKYNVIELCSPAVTRCYVDYHLGDVFYHANAGNDVRKSVVMTKNELKINLEVEACLGDGFLGETKEKIIEQGTITLEEGTFNLSINDLITLIHQKLNKKE